MVPKTFVSSFRIQSYTIEKVVFDNLPYRVYPLAELQTEAQSSLPEPLTDREHEILACLVEGLSNQEIAARLYLALRTVKWYNSQIYNKLAVNNRKEAVERAQALGLLKPVSDAASAANKHNLPAQS